jgi:hypothetical protein
MGMTEYEVAASALANFLTSLTVFLSIVSAYVISAFVAGEGLSRIQLLVVNLCFLVSARILGFIVFSPLRALSRN